MQQERNKPVALITGARQGLGKASALCMAKKGFDLVLMDLIEDSKAKETIEELVALGASVKFVQADLANVENHKNIINEAWNCFGGIDCLVNNAGVAARPLTDILDLSFDAFDFSLNINLRGSFFLTQAFANKLLVEKKSDFYRSVIFVTSIAAEHVSIDRSQYCISKAGLSMVSKLFAVRLAKENVHVHEVRPGFIETEMTASANTDKIDAYIESGGVPLRRWGKADDVGKLIAGLSSGEFPYLNGQAIYVDGAFHIPTA